MLDRLRGDDRGQMGGQLDLLAIMITVISAGVTGYVGLNVMTTTFEQAGLQYSGTAEANRTAWQNASADLTEGVESFFGGLGTVFTVIVLVVILAYLMLLRGR